MVSGRQRNASAGARRQACVVPVRSGNCENRHGKLGACRTWGPKAHQACRTQQRLRANPATELEPGVLRAPTSPPISSTSRFTIDKSQAGAAERARGGAVGLREWPKPRGANALRFLPAPAADRTASVCRPTSEAARAPQSRTRCCRRDRPASIASKCPSCSISTSAAGVPAPIAYVSGIRCANAEFQYANTAFSM
jgi:hypothetical protein